jgi:uncharacterized SAM-binding protein YcdF (DUF218 family)
MWDRLASLLEGPLVIHESIRALDAIVVLGAPLWANGRLSPILAERVTAAIELYRGGGAPIVVATGGKTIGATHAEADAMADALRAAGVPDIVVENQSRNTAENALFTARLLPRGARIWIVTQPFHGRRAARLFRDAGFEPHVWHIADSLEYRNRRHAMRWLVREYAAWGVLAFRSARDSLARTNRS